jgi:hypothetical protein
MITLYKAPNCLKNVNLRLIIHTYMTCYVYILTSNMIHIKKRNKGKINRNLATELFRKVNQDYTLII